MNDQESGCKPRSTKILTKSGLYCKARCGFYGNPAWEGYCSKCHREVYLNGRHQASSIRSEDFLTSAHTQSETYPNDEDQNFKFDKFEEKKKQKQESKRESVKKFFKKSPPSKTDSPSESVQKKIVFEGAKSELKAASREFVEFLKTLKRPATKDIKDKCLQFIMRFLTNQERHADQQSEIVQDFYAKMASHIQLNPSFKGNSAEEMETLMDGIEKFIMTHIYQVAFCPPLSDDEQKDNMLKEKIKSFSWVTFDQLEININFDKDDIKQLMEKAKKELSKVNSERAPQDKLSRIVKCSLAIFQMLQVTNNIVASADEFLPALIYVVLQLNPHALHSNIQYITRFCNPNKLMVGEAGYYFTNLCCAISFIMENLDAQSLNLTIDEFNSYMKGETPIRNPKILQRKYTVSCKGLEELQANLDKLAELHDCQAKTVAKCRQMRKEMTEFHDNIKKQMHAIRLNEHLVHGYVYIQHYMDQFENVSNEVKATEDSGTLVDQSLLVTEQFVNADQSELATEQLVNIDQSQVAVEHLVNVDQSSQVVTE